MPGPSDTRAGSYDDSLRSALERAAERIERDPDRPSLREETIENALLEAWPHVTDGGRAERSVSLPVPDWNPEPRQTDLAGATPGDEFPGFAAEVKIDDLDQTLWDLFKLLSVARGTPSIARCYLIVAGYPSRWTKVEVAEVFDPSGGTRVWDAREMFNQWRKPWSDLLRGGSGRPRRVHGEVRVTPVWRGDIRAFASESCELRCVAVEALPDCPWVAFDGDWPAPAP